MAIYEFQCPNCESEIEVEGSVFDTINLHICEHCNCTMRRRYAPLPSIGKKEKGYYNNQKKERK